MDKRCWFAGVAPAAMIISLSLLGACVPSCPPDYVKFESITDGWGPLDLLVFEPTAPDSLPLTGSGYDIDLTLRYSTRLPVSDFPLVVTMEDENGQLSCDTLIVPAASGKGARISTHYGVREVSVPLKSNVTLTDGFALTLAPLSDRRLTESLRAAGVVFTHRSGKHQQP